MAVNVDVEVKQKKLYLSWEGDGPNKPTLTDKQKDSVYLLSLLNETPIDVSKPSETDDIADKEEIISLKEGDNFYSWMDTVEVELNNEEEKQSRQSLKHLIEQQEQCNTISTIVSAALDVLDDLYDEYDSVSSKTNALHEACEHLMGSQNRMLERVRVLDESVKFFVDIDKQWTKVCSPSFQVNPDTLAPIFNTLAVCQTYLSSHLTYKETPVYQKKLNQCLQKCLILVHQDVERILDKTISKLSVEMQSANAEYTFTLLYGKFRSVHADIRGKVSLVEDRIDSNPLYRESAVACYLSYIARREKLLTPIVQNSVKELLVKYTQDHCTLLRSSGALLVRLCEDEINLFMFFFTRFSEYLNDCLRRLMQNFEDAFRPLLLHIHHLETLTELCTILRIEMMEEHVQNNVVDLTVFADMCHNVLADLQERLLYRTDIYIRTQILGFTPSQGDLAYPQKLEMMMSIAEEVRKSGQHVTYYESIPLGASSSAAAATNPGAASSCSAQEEANAIISESGEPTRTMGDPAISTAAASQSTLPVIISNHKTNMPLSPADLHGMWYPTVRRTLSCLSKLYRCLESEVFQALAQECVSVCVQSLLSASQKITLQNSSSPADGFLFLIKHLLILREQLTPFNVEFTVKETSIDFHKFKEAAMTLWAGRSRLLTFDKTNVLLQFLLERPDVIETVVDSRRQLDGELKRTCEAFIQHCSDKLTAPLVKFITQHAIRSSDALAKASPASPSYSSLPSAEVVHDVLSEAQRDVSKHCEQLLHCLHLYLANPETERILFRPVRAHTLKVFREMSVFVTTSYSVEDQAIIALPSEEQMSLLIQPGNSSGHNGSSLISAAIAADSGTSPSLPPPPPPPTQNNHPTKDV